MVALLAASLALQGPLQIAPPPPRFEMERPLPPVSGVMLDEYEDGMGLAQERARSLNLQARILWIDGTANLDRVNSVDKIRGLMARIAETGFNTVVFDIKPISGQVLYKSAIAPKIETWRGAELPLDFDPLPTMIEEAHKKGLDLFVSMNAFSEGHTLFKVGPGYATPDHQSVLYNPVPVLVSSDGASFDLATSLNTMPDSGASVHLFTDTSKVKAGTEYTYAVLGVNGDTLDISTGELGKMSRGSMVLVARDDGAAFLRQHARFARLSLDSRAEYVATSGHVDQYPLMMNPNDPAVQSRALAIMQEVVSKYAVDGVLYDDRLRFAGMNADFSPLSRGLFEAYVGKKLNWPDDVFKFSFAWNLHRGIKPGRFYDAWMTWRALQMRNWVARVRHTVKAARKSTIFGIYCGSWYGEYPAFGSNYGAPGLEAGFWYLTPKYAKTGFANLLDVLITGCYYGTPTVYDAMVEGRPTGPTIEAAGQLSNRVADDQCWAYAGIDPESYVGDTEGLEHALQAACGATQGVMVFDLSHGMDKLWPVFKQAFKFPAKAPHAVAGLLKTVRDLRTRYRKMGVKERPVVISAGSSGTGF